MNIPFNPLDMENLADSLIANVEKMPPVGLDSIPHFNGAGIYALYYTGNFPAYTDLIKANMQNLTYPIYVGKAVPQGSRRGLETVASTSTTALVSRLKEHATTLRSAHNLNLSDVKVRWLIVEDIWIPLGESALIRRYRPVWNAILDGFSNHDPGRGRINGKRSRWDTLHPGRTWAFKYPERNETTDHIIHDVQKYLHARLP